MAREHQQKPSPPPAPRLYLAVPAVERSAELARDLGALLDAAEVAAVLLRLPPLAERDLVAHVRAIAPTVQGRGVALVLDGHAKIAVEADVDGAHLTGIAALTAALERLKPARIAGAGGLLSRHDAMLAAERGADYVMFGGPGSGRPPFEAIIERVAWWSELFEPPCVAHAESLDEVAALAAAGADFVAIGALVFSESGAASTMIRAAAARLAPAPVKPIPVRR